MKKYFYKTCNENYGNINLIMPETPNNNSIENYTQHQQFRDMSIYEWRMNQALQNKLEQLSAHFPKIFEGDVIVDAGSGTGLVAETFAEQYANQRPRIIGLDISHELRNTAQQNQKLIDLKYGNAAEKNFPDGSIKVIYFSTSGHEVESFGGSGKMRDALKVSYNALQNEGKCIVRDFVKPDFQGEVLMEITSEPNEEDESCLNKDTTEIDYNQLSTHALLKRFHEEFQGGNAFKLTEVNINGKTYYQLPAEYAYEFYMRKNYTGNWRNEIHEKYSYWTQDEAKTAFETAGFKNIKITPEINEYMMSNWIQPEIKLYKLPTQPSTQLESLSFPPTHMTISGIKSDSNSTQKEADLEVTDYKKLVEQIQYDEKNKTLKFLTETYIEYEVTGPPIMGTKKLTYRLKHPYKKKPAVIKIVNPDKEILHNAFVCMQQSADRQHILEKYNISHAKILETYPQHPPYLYTIQESAPENSKSLAELLQTNQLSDTVIKQLCNIVNQTELDKQWQVDTNPYNWVVAKNEACQDELIYIDGKVYMYDEHWRFARIGLLQYINSQYLETGQNCSPSLPTNTEFENFKNEWYNSEKFSLWKKYLHPSLWP